MVVIVRKLPVWSGALGGQKNGQKWPKNPLFWTPKKGVPRRLENPGIGDQR